MALTSELRCIWCGTGYPPGEPTREHLLPDYMGVSAMLQKGLVCKSCNNRLNTSIDQPLKRTLQPLLTMFGVRSGKRSSASGVQVTVDSDRGPLIAILDPARGLRFSPRILHERQEGSRREELWVVPMELRDKFIAARRRSRKFDFEMVESGEVRLGSPTATLRANGGVLKRAAVRAGVNAIAWRRLDLVREAFLDDAIRYVNDESGHTPDLPGEASAAFRDSIDPSQCRPEHRVLVAATPKSPCWMELRVFGDLFCRVQVTETWAGPPLALDEFMPITQFVMTK